MKEIKDDGLFKEHRKTCEKLKADSEMKKMEDNLFQKLGKANFSLVWPYLKVYGEI